MNAQDDLYRRLTEIAINNTAGIWTLHIEARKKRQRAARNELTSPLALAPVDEAVALEELQAPSDEEVLPERPESDQEDAGNEADGVNEGMGTWSGRRIYDDRDRTSRRERSPSAETVGYID